MSPHDLAHAGAGDADYDNVVVLNGVTWPDYLRLLRIRGERSVPRLAYRKGVLEIMNPSPSHESIKSRIGRLVETYCLEEGIYFEPVGSWTIKDKASDSGVEPDECYYFGARDLPARPDLAIEVEWSRRMEKLAIYRALGVSEVWLWRKGAITISLLARGKYRTSAKSRALPGIDVAEICSLLDRPTFDAIREYQRRLRKRNK